MDFSGGKIYLIQSNIQLNEKQLISCNYATYLNFPFDEAKKIIPFFENLGIDEQKQIVTSIQELYGLKIRLDDLFGKLIVVLFFCLESYDLLIVGLAGLGDNSIDTLIEIARKMIANKKDKTIIFTKTSPKLSERVSVSVLSN